jgi:hypothetical protein
MPTMDHAPDDAPPTDLPADALDPVSGNPRTLMQQLLPAARTGYVKAWELLADASTPLERRRAARARATAMADDHAVVAAALRAREPKLAGDDLLNLRHLAGELERHAEALTSLSTISPIGLQSAANLRPEALGCGRRYRDPARVADDAVRTRAASATPGTGGRGTGRGRRPERGDEQRPRDPKVPRDAIGTSKHDSALGDDLDEATRAKLEALRDSLGG